MIWKCGKEKVFVKGKDNINVTDTSYYYLAEIACNNLVIKRIACNNLVIKEDFDNIQTQKKTLLSIFH
jgi:hypothetical protein